MEISVVYLLFDKSSIFLSKLSQSKTKLVSLLTSNFREVEINTLYIIMAKHINIVDVIEVREWIDKYSVVDLSLGLSCDTCWFFFLNIARINQSIVVFVKKAWLKNQFFDFITITKNVVVFISVFLAELHHMQPWFLYCFFGEGLAQ